MQCCLPDSEIDLVYGIGGAPEGVVTGAAVQALGGEIQGRLIPRNQVKGNTPENMLAAEKEIARCAEMQVLVNQVLKIEEIVKDDNVLFAATGITTGDLLKGVHRKGSMLFTETLLIRGRSHTIRRVESLHDVLRMDD